MGNFSEIPQLANTYFAHVLYMFVMNMAHSTRNCSDGLNQLHVSMDSHAKRVAFFVGASPMVRNACTLRIWGFRNKKNADGALATIQNDGFLCFQRMLGYPWIAMRMILEFRIPGPFVPALAKQFWTCLFAYVRLLHQPC